jgi:sugar phosphate isomerase/epimerase
MVIDHLKKVIAAAGMMGVPVVNTFIGADRSLTQDENWAKATRVWPEIISSAQDAGVRIAIENCPMIFSTDEWPSGHNVAYNPRIWRRMFEEFGETIGLNFDPSHLVWLMIDIESAILEFGERFYHFQAKDVMVDYDGLYEHGTLSSGMGWQIPRLPGLGHVEWGVVFSALYRAGYDGPIIIEHEDRDFEETDELVKRGFLIARDVLQPYVH